MTSSLVVRHGPSRAYAVLTWLIAAVFLISFALEGGLAAVVRYGAYPLLLAVAGWVVFWQPRVVLEDDAVTLVNVARSVRVPYRAITGLSTRWGLSIATTSGRHQAWAAPSRALNRRDDTPAGAGSGDAQSVAREVERRCAREADGGGDAAPPPPRLSVNVRELTAVVLAVAAAAAAVVLGR